MAFNQRTCREKFFSDLSLDTQEGLRKIYLTSFINDETDISDLFPYDLSQKSKSWLISEGFDLPLYANQNHTHPVCKSIENFILFKFLVPFTNRVKSVCAFSMKNSKRKFISHKLDSNTKINLVNSLIVAKDAWRYTKTGNCQDRESKFLPREEGLNYFFFDEMHYWSENKFVSFLRCKKPKEILTTFIYPPELLCNVTTSLNPNVYEFEVKKGKFLFMPDGRRSEGYLQDVNINWIFDISSLEVSDGVFYNFSLIRSIGAHHVFHIWQSSEPTLPERRSFDSFTHVPFSSFAFGFGSLNASNFRISYDVLKKTIAYLMTLKRVDPQSSIAKFRQLANDNFETSELLFIRQIEQEIERQGFDGIFNKGILNWFSSKVKDLIDPLVESVIGHKIYRGLTEDILNYSKFSLDIDSGVKLLSEVDMWLLGLGEGASSGGSAAPVEGPSPDSFESISVGLKRTKGGPDLLNKDNIFGALIFGFIGREQIPNCALRFICSYRPLECKVDSTGMKCVLYNSNFAESQIKRSSYIPEVSMREIEEMDPFTKLFFESRLKERISDLFSINEGQTSGQRPTQGSGVRAPGLMKECKMNKGKGLEETLFVESMHPFTSTEVGSSSSCDSSLGCLAQPESEVEVRSGVKKISGNEATLESELAKDEVTDDFVKKENSCLLIALAKILKERESILIRKSAILEECYERDEKVGIYQLGQIASELNCCFYLVKEDGVETFGTVPESNENKEVKPILFSNGHYFVEECYSGFFLSRNPSHFRKELAEWNMFSTGSYIKNKMAREGQKGLTEGLLRVSDLDFKRAAKLMSSFLFSASGCKLDSPFNEGWRVIPGLKKEDCSNVSRCCSRVESILKSGLLKNDKSLFREIGISCVSGAPGSGKSRIVVETLKELSSLNDERSLFVSPRSMLKEEIVCKVSAKGQRVKNVKTYELALTGNIGLASLVVIDELPILPNGYLDLIVSKWLMERTHLGLDFSGCRLLILCDPMQSNYHMREDLAFLDKKGEFQRLKEILPKINYLNHSWRLGNEISGRFGLEKIVGNDKPKWKFQDEVFQDLTSALAITGMKEKVGQFDEVCVLVPSCDEVTSSSFKEGMATYNKSQGINSRFCFIGLSAGSHKSSDNQIYVALTRASSGFCFFLSDCRDVKSFLRRGKAGLLSRYLEKDFTSVAKYIKVLHDKSMVLDGYTGGSFEVDDEPQREILCVDGVDREEKSKGDPWMKGMLHLMADDGVLLTNDSNNSVVEVKDGIKCHLPVVDKRNFSLRLDAIKAREFREFKDDSGWSKQFCEEKGRWCSNLLMDLPQCSMVRAIYPRHFADDDLTFKAAVHKRLRFSNYSKEKAKFNDNLTKGKIIFDNFNKYFNLREERNNTMFMEAEREFMQVKMSKNAATIENHSGRSDPDWEWNKVLIFMKSQLCSKFEKRFADAKAGQTLACFSHETLFRFNAWCRYTEKIFMRNCPKNFYIHQKRSFEDLNEFAKRYAGRCVSVESDYEAFDASQDSLILAFEYHLLRHIGWPEDVLNDYLEMKFSLFSKLGNFAIMRFTGEFCTFLFNTFANIAFTLMRYDIKGNEPICFAGDDMCALANLKLSNKFDSILSSLSLKAKVVYTERPTFCGWLMTEFGIVKRPELILERLVAASEVGKLEQVMDSYFLELSYGYRLGECLFQIFSENEIDDQQQLVRFFVKKGAYLKGASQAILFNLQYLSDDE